METQYWRLDGTASDQAAIAAAAALIKTGGVVAFPTETVYGLGANGLDAAAVGKIFAAKGRPADNPLILHVASLAQAKALVREIDGNAERLMQAFWPGPLTLVLKKTDGIPDCVTAGLDTVAVRWPDHPVAQALIQVAGVPIAAPSANLSGRPSPTDAQDVLADMSGLIDGVLDGGRAQVGVESTVVDCTGPTPVVLRPGGITLEALEAEVGVVELDPALSGDKTITPKAPGMKYRHYAPKAPLWVVEGAHAPERLLEMVNKQLLSGRRVGALVSIETAERLPEGVITFVYGSRGDAAALAEALYRLLRAFDRTPANWLVAEGVGEAGMGLAVMNRLRKAAGWQIIRT